MDFFNPKNTASFEEIIQFYFDEYEVWKESDNKIEILASIIETIRPHRPKEINAIDLSSIIKHFKENDDQRKHFSAFIKHLIAGKKFSSILTDAGILQDTDFLYEVKKRLFSKILPYQAPKESLEYVLNQVFYLNSAPVWIDKIVFSQLEELYDVLEFSSLYESSYTNSALSETFQSMILLSQRASGKALETDVMKMVPEYIGKESPFAALEKELYAIEDNIKESYQNRYVKSNDLSYKQLLILFNQCVGFVDKAFQNTSKFGISLKVNQSLLRIRQQLARLKILIPLLVIEDENEKRRKTILLGLHLINFNCYKNNVRKLINESTQLISYEITQHTAKTGEKYITESSSEYFKMFKAAIGGGLIVSFLCIFKTLLSKIDASAFGHAFLYSMNYSFGFIAIYLLSYTLATKQPAMTAAALIRALEDGMKKRSSVTDNDKHETFARLFARLFRSQFIAFAGNVLIAFPVSLLLIWLIDLSFGVNITETKWEKMSSDLSPVHSLSILHAAIAGVFLFLSGIISGSVSNRDKHFQVYYRIQEHPWLKLKFGKEKTLLFSKIYEEKWPGIISNFWFGIFLGSTATIGVFLGLNLDIRHITFASGNLALAMYGSHFTISNSMIFWGVLGVGIIGLVNFLVSFSLSLGLAFRSRNIPLSEIKLIFFAIKKHFREKPMSFFFPSTLVK